MFASIDGAGPGYMALAPHIPDSRHVSPPSIAGNNLVDQPKRHSGRPSSAEAPARMDSSFPEYMAILKSTLRWAT